MNTTSKSQEQIKQEIRDSYKGRFKEIGWNPKTGKPFPRKEGHFTKAERKLNARISDFSSMVSSMKNSSGFKCPGSLKKVC